MSFLRTFSAAVLPDGAFRAAQSAKSFFTARSHLPVYRDLIRSAFPDIAFARARLITSGFANVVLILDEDWVFRFPRNEYRRLALFREIRLLSELRPKTSFALPHYTHVAPDESFAGYRMIRGRELRPELFHALDRQTQESVASQFAGLLSALHALPPSLATAGERARVAQTNAEHRAHYFAKKRRHMARKLGATLPERLDRLYSEFLTQDRYQERLINSDIDDDHLLWDGERAGLIDFGDVTIGDPAIDFALLWAYPDWVAPFVFDRYAFPQEKEYFLARSKSHAARRMADRLWYCLRHEGQHRALRDTVGAMENQLALLGI